MAVDKTSGGKPINSELIEPCNTLGYSANPKTSFNNCSSSSIFVSLSFVNTLKPSRIFCFLFSLSNNT